MNIVIDALAWRHVARFASTDETRPTLQHVFAMSCGILVATNGHALLAWRGAVTGATRDVALSLDAKVTKSIVRIEAMIPDDAPTAPREFSARMLNIRDEAKLSLGHEYDSPYPDWRQVFPMIDPADKPHVRMQLLNPELAGMFALDAERPAASFTPTGEGRAMLVRYPYHEHIVGIMMPMGLGAGATDERTVPEWVRHGALPNWTAPDVEENVA